MTVQQANEIGGVGTIAALGVFDGVHLGHLALFSEAAVFRAETGLPVVAMTFHPHPRTLTGQPNGYARLLTPPAEKAALLQDAGADYLVSVPFTRELASTPPFQFAREFLAAKLNARRVVCGFNFAFGHRGAGTPDDLVRWGSDLGYSVSVVPPYLTGGEAVSSTRVRIALAAGDVDGAARCLGRPYCLHGRVATGDGRGHSIGIPTSNVDVPPDKLVPGNGVYAALARVMASPCESGAAGASQGIQEYPAVVNVGARPTFGGEGVRVEAHIPGFEGILYGRVMQVFFIARLRDELKFPDAVSLRTQVEEDVRRAAKMLPGIAPLAGTARKAALCKASSFTIPGAYDRMLASSLP